MSIITVQDLRKNFKTYQRGHSFSETLKNFFHREMTLVEAVKGISFDIEEGRIIGLLGPNGAGKSTTIKIMTGVLYPTSGNVNVCGYIPWKQRSRYVANIGAVFGQKSQLVWDIPPIDAYYMNKAIYGIPDGDFKKRLDYMTELFCVGGEIRKPTRGLSLGERMKCEFIMAMLHGPRVVFLDEPTIGLDVVAKDTIREFIRELNKQGTTFILTTHDLSDVERLAESVIVINRGEIVFNNNLSALKHHLGEETSIENIIKSLYM